MHRLAVERGGDAEEFQRQIAKKDDIIKGLDNMVKTLQAMVAALQTSHINQAVQLYNLASKSKASNQLFAKAIAGVEGELAICARLRGELRGARATQVVDPQPEAAAVAKANGEQAEALAQAANRLARRKELMAPCWSSVKGAFVGVKVQKVSFKSGKREERLLEICKDDPSSQVRLRWAKKPFKSFPKSSCLLLSRVILIGYGFMARAWAMFDDVSPERSFSIFTVRRSFDFICEKDSDAEAFVIALSRLCSSIQGWRVPGSIESHKKFLCARGWCKLEASCRKRNMPLARRFLDAIAKTHMRSMCAGGGGRLPPRPTGSASLPVVAPPPSSAPTAGSAGDAAAPDAVAPIPEASRRPSTPAEPQVSGAAVAKSLPPPPVDGGVAAAAEAVVEAQASSRGAAVAESLPPPLVDGGATAAAGAVVEARASGRGSTTPPAPPAESESAPPIAAPGAGEPATSPASDNPSLVVDGPRQPTDAAGVVAEALPPTPAADGSLASQAAIPGDGVPA